MPKTTKKAEKAALAKARRKIREKNATRQASKGSGLKAKSKTHPHRRSSSIAARRG